MTNCSYDSTELRQVQSQACHPRTFQLKVGPRAVYATLCALLAPGETRRLSQEQIALVGGISESTVSRAMPILEEFELVTRDPAPGGHDITLMQLDDAPSAADLLAAATSAEKGSVADGVKKGSATDPALECGAKKGSPNDPTSCMDDHVLYSDHQHHQRASVRVSFSPAQAALYQRLTTNPDMNRHLAEEIATAPPGSARDFDEDLARAKRRGKQAPFWFVVGIWRHGQRVAAPQENNNARGNNRGHAERRGNSAGSHSRPGGRTPGTGAANRAGATGVSRQPATKQPPALAPGTLEAYPTRAELRAQGKL